MAGSFGATGPTGPADPYYYNFGAVGSGMTGPSGPIGLGVTGAVGPAGPIGPGVSGLGTIGVTGATGPMGPVNIYYFLKDGEVTTTNPSPNVGLTSSDSFVDWVLRDFGGTISMEVPCGTKIYNFYLNMAGLLKDDLFQELLDQFKRRYPHEPDESERLRGVANRMIEHGWTIWPMMMS